MFPFFRNALATLALAAIFAFAQEKKAAPAPPPPSKPAPAASAGKQNVVCSYYAVRYNGRRTSSGQRFNSNAMTAAHRTLALGTRVRLTNPANHKSVIVKVNDRGPYVDGRDISVTRRAALALGFVKQGKASLEMEVLGK